MNNLIIFNVIGWDHIGNRFLIMSSLAISASSLEMCWTLPQFSRTYFSKYSLRRKWANSTTLCFLKSWSNVHIHFIYKTWLYGNPSLIWEGWADYKSRLLWLSVGLVWNSVHSSPSLFNLNSFQERNPLCWTFHGKVDIFIAWIQMIFKFNPRIPTILPDSENITWKRNQN